MLLEILDSPIRVDEKPIINSFRLKIIPEKRQLRAKIVVPTDEGEELIDLVVRHWSDVRPSLKSGISLEFSAEGEELESNYRFSFRIYYEIQKDRWSLTGNVGPAKLEIKSKTLDEAFNSVTKKVLELRTKNK